MLSASVLNLKKVFAGEDRTLCLVKKRYRFSSFEILNYSTENAVMAMLTPSF